MSMRRRIVPALLPLALVALFCPAAALAQGPGAEAARAFRQAHAADILRDYAGLLSLPNGAGDRPVSRSGWRVRRQNAYPGMRT
jgi:hypothetical protein